MAMGGGAGLLIAVVAALVFGVDLNSLPVGGSSGPAEAMTRVPDRRGRERAARLPDRRDGQPHPGVLGRRARGSTSRRTRSSSAARSRPAAATRRAPVGPFYCPRGRSRSTSISTSSRRSRAQLGARGGPFAEAYVLAHEYGHHVQNLTGVLERARGGRHGRRKRRGRGRAPGRLLRGRLGERTRSSTGFIEELTQDDIDRALDAAAAVGDDRIQERTQGQVNPETWTHGSAEQRQQWFTTGYRTRRPGRLRHLRRLAGSRRVTLSARFRHEVGTSRHRHVHGFGPYGGFVARKAATAWGEAAVVDEVRLPQRAGAKRFAASRRSSSRRRAARSYVRFAYTTDGTTRRGPVTLRPGRRRLGGARPASGRWPARSGARASPSGEGGGRGRRGLSERARSGGREASRSRAASTSDARTSAPSPEPSSGSTACSGCGMRPMTFAVLVHDAGDVGHGAVRVLAVGVAEHDLAVRVELGEELGRRVPAAVAVLDRDRERLARLAAARERRVRPLDPDIRRRGRRRRATGSGAGRRAGARPRRGSGSRCRSRARARPRRRRRRPRASPARSGRSRPRAGSRRTRTRPGGRPRPRAAVSSSRVPDEDRVGAERGERPAGVAVVVRAGEDEDGDLRADLGHASPTSIS